LLQSRIMVSAQLHMSPCLQYLDYSVTVSDIRGAQTVDGVIDINVFRFATTGREEGGISQGLTTSTDRRRCINDFWSKGSPFQALYDSMVPSRILILA